MTKVLAHYDGRAIVPDQVVDLSIGDELEITFEVRQRDPADPPRGSAAAVLAAMRAGPHLSADDVDELNRSIESGRTPPTTVGCFDDLDGIG